MITVDPTMEIIDVEDIGVTLRTLLAVAARAAKERPKRTWKIRYKKAILGSIRVKLDK
jgi:hypothetical protein